MICADLVELFEYVVGVGAVNGHPCRDEGLIGVCLNGVVLQGESIIELTCGEGLSVDTSLSSNDEVEKQSVLASVGKQRSGRGEIDSQREFFDLLVRGIDADGGAMVFKIEIYFRAVTCDKVFLIEADIRILGGHEINTFVIVMSEFHFAFSYVKKLIKHGGECIFVYI